MLALTVGSTPVSAQSCLHGYLHYDGTCECDTCWTGSGCDTWVNSHAPVFDVEFHRVKASPSTPYLYTAEANDLDSEKCFQCSCAVINYRLDAGNEHDLFKIDPTSGLVELTYTDLAVYKPFADDRHMINLNIVAYNPSGVSEADDDVTSGMTLAVSFPDNLWDSDDSDDASEIDDFTHHRHKRAIVLPGNVTFTLTKTGNSQNITEMRVGTKISFQLQILFPQTPTDMLVELFAPDNDSIVMMLCDVRVVSIGTNLGRSRPGNIVMDSQNSSNKFYDRAIIDFGNVTNSITDLSTETASSIFITWNAVMIQNAATVDQAVYWVSAGAEYNYEMEIWVGQASFTARTNTDPTLFAAPVFNLTGPSTMQIGSSALFTLDMYITKPSAGLSVDAFAPLNNSNIMSVCDFQVVDTGTNYLCGFIPSEHKAVFYSDSNTRGYGRARLNFGTVTNKGARDSPNPMAANRISVQFVVHLYNDPAYVGQSYYVGAGVDIGAQHIWAGEILVTAVALNTGASISPSWVITKKGSGQISTLSPLLMSLDITVPKFTTASYGLEVLAPFNSSAAVFQLCSVRMTNFGRNVPCTDPAIVPQYSSRGSPTYPDRALASLGTLSNVGTWGYQPYNITNPNALPPDVVRVEFFMTATNHSLATAGSVHNVTLGLLINDNRMLVGTFDVQVEAAPVLPNITDATTPSWNMSWVSGNGNIKIGGAGQFVVSMTTKNNTVYSPFDFEALMPNNTVGVTQVAICKLQVHFVGRNLPCVVPSAINSSFTYTSLLGDGYNDRGVLNLPSVCNLQLVNDSAQDVLAVRVGFQLRSNTGLVNGTQLWHSVGVMFSPYKMWVGQIAVVARSDLPNTGLPPYVVVMMSTAGNVPIGYYVTYNVLIKPQPGDSVPYTVNVSANTASGYSVCSVKVVQVGINLPCVNQQVLEAVYQRDPLTGVNYMASIDMGTVCNTGAGPLASNTTVDDNTIMLEVTIGLTPKTAVIANGATGSFGSVAVIWGSSTITPDIPTFIVTHNQTGIVTASNVTKVELSVAPISVTDNTSNVVLGQSKRLQLCAWTYPGSVTKLSMKMLTPIDVPGALETTYGGLSYVGKNMPCASSCKSTVTTYEPRTVGGPLIDVATVNLGYVLNNNFDSLNPDANKICIDGVFRVQKGSTLTPGSTIQASASLNVNDVEITVLQLALTVTSNSTFTDIYPDNTTLSNGTLIAANSSLPDPVCLTPGVVRTFPLTLSIPPFITSMVDMDIKLDVNLSACMTFKEMRLISVGRNLRGFGKAGDLTCTANSSMGTTQMDVVECTFGVVTNPGMSHRCDNFVGDDNSMYVEVDLQMADCLIAQAGTNLTASFGIKVASYIAILNFPVMVCRTGLEAPVFNLSAVANSTGDLMYIEYNLRLDNTSKAELRNASLVVTPPPYINCSAVVAKSHVNRGPVLDATSPNFIVIGMGDVYFTDEVKLLLRCEAIRGYFVPSGINGYYSVVNHQMVGDVYPRTGSLLTSTEFWSDLDFVNVTATTYSTTGEACTSTALGLNDSNVVYDCQISGSLPTLTSFLNGRKGRSGWQPYVRSGQLGSQRYFQVFFPNPTLVDRVEVGQNGVSRTVQIKMAYSNDGQSFLDGDTITLAGTPIETVQIPNPQKAKVIRIYLTSENLPGQGLGLKFELYGCKNNDLIDKAAVCAAVNQVTGPHPLFYHRSFLALPSGSVFVCDGVVLSKGAEKRCFLSNDGAVWQPLDDRLASVVGHDPVTGRLFGLHQNGQTFMASDDLGQMWATVHNSSVLTAKDSLDFLSAVNVPWVDTTNLTTGAPAVDKRMNTWGASFDSLQKNTGTWTSKINWDCC